ncbi:carbohydrate sulfotransferase 15-like [Bolinopsis microptera]|uniref:carbohydrate sulfotransferase 15-like n=1 Tax=Bolinopsis microptera TaxID=2820187 RepID=UPI0030790F9C
MVISHRGLKSKVVWILLLIASFQFIKMLLETENFKNISSATEDHIIFLSNNTDQVRDNVKDSTEQLDGTGTILDIDDTLTSQPRGAVIDKNTVPSDRQNVEGDVITKSASNIFTKNEIKTSDTPYETFVQQLEEVNDTNIFNVTEKHQKIEFLKYAPSNVEMLKRGVPKKSTFGDPNEMNCNDTFCYLNGRTLKKEHITENPKDMFTFLPPEEEFLKEFKNPCWKGNDLLDREAMFCLPYFYIIGFTKAGTTDLFFILNEHILISARSKKETHYFDRGRRGRSIRMHRMPDKNPTSFMGYSNSGPCRDKLMKTYKEFEGTDVLFHGITVDATPSHVWDNEFWETFHPGYKEPPVTTADTLAKLNPKTKFIFSLRDPIKRMQSAYQFFCTHIYTYNCDRPITPEKYHNLVVEAVDKFNNCLKVNTLRGCTYSTETHQLATHLYASIYHVYILDYMKVFPKNQIYILQMEERIRDPITTYNNLCDFLEIPRFPDDELQTILEQHKIKNAMSNNKKLPYVLTETTELLEKFFKPYLRDLVDLLGDEKWYWNLPH